MLAAVPLTLATYALATIALQRDWADGAQIAGVVVAVMVVAALVAGAILIIRRSAQPLMALLTGALLLVLAVSGVGTLVGQPALHSIQAGSLEHDREWTAAIREYTLAGEQTPHAPNIARVHLEWGEDLLLDAQYLYAAVSFFYLAQGDDTASTIVAARATGDLKRAYHIWFASDPKTFPFGPAIAFLTRYPASAGCDTSCSQDIHLFVAQLKFTQANDEYLPTRCDLALPIYQDLAANYADTTYGVQAGSALLAPVDVIGSIVNMPGSILATAPTMYLSSRLYPMVLDQIQYYSADYATTLDSSGGFVFHRVRPGKYNLSIKLANGHWTYWRYPSPYNPYTVVVNELCNTQLEPYPWQ